MKVLFYDDGNSFGGHTLTALDAVRYLGEQTDLNVGFMFYEGNKRLHERLNLLKHSNVELYPIKWQEPKLRTIEALFSFAQVQKVKSLIDQVQPDIIIISQGCIEQCSIGLLAAKSGKYKTISFIALTQEISVMGGKLAQFRDWVNLYFYKLSDAFITTSQNAKNRLIQHGVRSKISLVYYGPNLKFWQFRDKSEFRRKLGINENDYVVALIGRVQFAHKGHDFLINSIAKYQSKLENIKLVLVGDGPDVNRLQSLIQSYSLSHFVKLVSWSDDPSYIYSAIDMLIIPSRFEGLPLVMLEAMYYSLPIVASNVDGMAEVLPKDWLFQFGDSNSLIETLLQVKQQDNREVLAKNKMRIMTEFNVDKFGEEFYKAISEK
ncbi:glycosyltransferase family 4 protein [Iningainema tapete]|uniref:Glycosyltransferase family 4 protein n=1 Tax=Iningainema tapete BLCC-T55 TaxID=2748662 RepID=A0A8J6XRW8_9CYAN|nr:glycosyltransferase family 4 protein [Iningainema tapete]MBD2778482.1 glycosyltransferase family 4 protein [Iningainema tapete BLCC-T55]